MSYLSYIDRAKFEKIFGMNTGYVLDFSNFSFQEFIADSVQVDIYGGEYEYDSCSKANLLRCFIKKANKKLVVKLLTDLLEYWRSITDNPTDKELILFTQYQKITKELLNDLPVQNIDAITPNSEDVDFEKISEIIRSHIEDNKPEVALDRLHTFLMKYVRNLCKQHELPYGKEEPLHSLFGKYNKFLKYSNIIESNVTFKILGSCIQILEKFNKVRNDSSLTHDNPLLNYQESLLIFNNICNSIQFINFIEKTFF